MVNTITGVGLTGRDKRLASVPILENYDPATAETLWRSSDLASRIVEVWPYEMLREGFELVVAAEGDRDIAETVQAMWEDLQGTVVFQQALNWERALGGSGILMGTGEPLEKPLVLANQVTHLTVFEGKTELNVYSWYDDPTLPNYGEPEFVDVTPVTGPGRVRDRKSQYSGAGTLRVHASHMILFPGVRTSRRVMLQQQGFGDSIFNRIGAVLRDHNASWDTTSVLMQDFSQAVFKMQALAELFAQGESRAIRERIETLDYGRSVLRAILIDADESFERTSTPVTGLPELLDRFMTRLAAAADMPLTLLMGQSPAGLNATGASDIRFFYDRVAARQRTYLQPKIEQLIRVLLQVPTGPTSGDEPEKWSIKFRPLWQQTEKEVAESRNIQANTDVAYLNSGVLSPDEVARSRFGGAGYSYETMVDFDEREKMELVEPVPADSVPPEEGVPQDAEPEGGEEDDDREDSYRLDRIEKRGRKWVVLSESGEILGEHETRSAAVRQLAAVEASKHGYQQ